MKTITIKLDVDTNSTQEAETLAESLISQLDRADTHRLTVSNARVKSVKDAK